MAAAVIAKRSVDPEMAVPDPKRRLASDVEFVSRQEYTRMFRRGDTLGAGSTGVVIAMTSTRFPRQQLAVKEIECSDFDELANGLDECETALAVGRHPHLCTTLAALAVTGAVDGSGTFVLVMERAMGYTLYHHLRDTRQAKRQMDAGAVLAQCLAALAAVHAAGYAHCDVKPENLLLRELVRPGETPHLQLCDFSSANVIDTDTGLFRDGLPNHDLCTAYYRAPECSLAVLLRVPTEVGSAPPRLGQDIEMRCGDESLRVGAPMDVWAAACVAVECLRDSPLFYEEENHELMRAMLLQLGAPQPEWPPATHWLQRKRLLPILRPSQACVKPVRAVLWDRLVGMEACTLNTLRSLLRWDPEERPSAEQALEQLGRQPPTIKILKD